MHAGTGTLGLASSAILLALLPAACSLDASGRLASDDGATDATAPVRPPFDASVIDDRSSVDDDARDVTAADDVATGDDPVGVDVSIPLESGAPDAVDELPVTDCDQDGDGYLAPACGGNDCCDIDSLAYPGETSYVTFPTNCGGFDFNCDGVIEPLYPVVACSGHGAGCGGSGIAAPGACGASFAAQACVWSPPSCVPQDTGATEQQACQ